MKKFNVFLLILAVGLAYVSCNIMNAPGDTSGSAPGTPIGLSAEAASANSINLSWSAVSGANGYFIYRSSSATGTFDQIGSSTTTTYTNTGLDANTAYFYRIAAYNNSGTGSQSNTANATTLPANLNGAVPDLNGTWVPDHPLIEGLPIINFNNGIFIFYEIVDGNETPVTRGPYTASEGKITLTVEEVYSGGLNLFEAGMFEAGMLESSKWYTKSELREILISIAEAELEEEFLEIYIEVFIDNMLDSWFSTATWNYSISGNTLTVIVIYDGEESEQILIKRD